MKKFYKDIECPKCKNTFKTQVTGSQLIPDFYLDMKPIRKDRVSEQQHSCPICGYTWYILCDLTVGFDSPAEDMYEVYKTALEQTTNFEQKLFVLLHYAWELEYNEKTNEAIIIRTQITDVIAEHLVKDPKVELILLYIENCRLTNQFEEADKAIEALNSFMSEHGHERPKFLKLYEYMTQLVANKDSSPHLLSEIKD